MLSISTKLTRGLLLAAASAASMGIIASPASAQVSLGLTNIGQPNAVCIDSDAAGTMGVSTEQDCDADFSPAPFLSIGNLSGDHVVFNATTGTSTFNATANFNDQVNFNSNNVSFNSANVAFGGGSATFNNTVSFTGPSVTFSTGTTFQNPATFNAAITTNGITNTGTVSTAGLTALTVNSGSVSTGALSVTNSLAVGAGTAIDMGNNQIHGVAAGTADTDAVNVAQLNAATAGITADVTALETTTATHTTQITALETTTATHTTQISTLNTDVSNLQTTTATHTTQISAIQAVNATQATQITALQAADTVFDNRIDTLELIASDLGERIDKVDDRASAGTAAAVALSGAMFLPGKTFNLTGNFGTYRGAHAAALQFGALVSDNVAINAGVAHGFNKGGKTALRAGFTIGW